MVYGGVDLLTTKVPQGIQKIQETAQDVTGGTTTTPQDSVSSGDGRNQSPAPAGTLNLSSPASATGTQIVGGYKEREEEFINSLKDVPAQRLTQEFKVPTSINERSMDAQVDNVLEESSTFDSFKSLLYKGLDAVASSSSSSNEIGASPSSPLKRLPSSLQTREVQARLLASDEEFLEAMEALQSDNPVTRLAAGYKVRRMVDRDEVLKRRRERAVQREEQALAIKTGFYQAGDALVGGVKALVELPPKVAETYESTVVGTRKTIAAAQALPEQVKNRVETVQKQVEDVQQSVQDSVETTKDIIEKTKQLPGDIQNKVKETRESVQKTAKETKETIEGIGEVAQELTTSSKVLLGLEKPVPRPPKAVPKEIQEELSLAKLGWKALSATGSLAGKVTWVVGKETTKLAWKGAEMAFSKGKDAFDEAAAKDQKRRDLAASAFSSETDNTASSTVVVEETDSGKPVSTTKVKETTPVTSDVPDKKLGNKTSRRAKDTKPPKSIEQDMSSAQQTDETTLTLEKQDDKKDMAENEDPRSSERLAKRKEELELSVLDLELEISEALRLAEVAIESAKAEMDDIREDGDTKSLSSDQSTDNGSS